MRRDLRPYYAFGALLALLAVLLAVPATRAWLAEEVGEPVRAQADPSPGLRAGYSTASMLVWATVGLALAWVAFDLVVVRLRYAPDRAFFLALSPFLVFGPLFHAILAVGALPAGSALAYLAAEPPVYLTSAVLAVASLLAGRYASRPLLVPLVLGALVLMPCLALAAPRLDMAAWRLLGIVAALALLPAAVAAFALRAREDPLAAGALVSAHGLDGATTWMVLRDPFGLGVGSFAEKNPFSERLVGLSNGWPYYAVKLALPLVILALVRRDEGDPRQGAFLLFGVFVLGYGPGASNLFQVLLA